MADEYPLVPAIAQLTLRKMAMERYATNGNVRLRYFSSQRKYDIAVIHDMLTGAECATLKQFYENNRTYPFTFTADEDGEQRLCYFAPQPFDIEPIAGILDCFQATVYLREA